VEQVESIDADQHRLSALVIPMATAVGLRRVGETATEWSSM
jgi:hypothetical protein